MSSANNLGFETKLSDKSLHLLRKVAVQEFNLEESLPQQLSMFNAKNLELIFTFYHLKVCENVW